MVNNYITRTRIMKKNLFMAGICLVVFGVVTAARGDVIVTNVHYSSIIPNMIVSGSGLSLTVTDRGGGNYDLSDDTLIPYRLFSANYGLEFTYSNINWNTQLLTSKTSSQTFSVNETKLYTFWEDLPGSDLNTPDQDDYYGWFSLTHTGSELLISDSATATSGGIIVGTYTQIPEPSSALLLTMGSGGILFYRRAKRCKREGNLSRRSFG